MQNMEMVIMPAEQVRIMMIEAASIAVKHNSSPATVATPPDEPLSPDEAAALFKTSKVSIWNWEKKGLIKGYHLGNKKYFLRNELMSALTKRGSEAV
jgi:hypothetical protein